MKASLPFFDGDGAEQSEITRPGSAVMRLRYHKSRSEEAYIGLVASLWRSGRILRRGNGYSREMATSFEAAEDLLWAERNSRT
jgi:hypothetical protein